MVTIESATLEDLPVITEIYNEAVLTTTATFDTEPKSVAKRQPWFEEHGSRYPVLVARIDNVVVGWVSLSCWSPKTGYAGTVEGSLYVGSAYRGRGIGKRLMAAILAEGQKNGYHTVLARVVEGNETSIGLHEAFGFELVGVMREVGYKFNRWLDVYLMQKVY